MYRSIGRLGRNVLVQGVPADALDVMAVLSNLADQSPRAGIVDASNVVHTADDEVYGVGGPGQIVDLSAAGPTHMLGPPRLLVLELVRAKVVRGCVAGYPEYHVAVVAGGSQSLA